MSISTSLSAEEILKQASSERDAGRLDEAERLYRSVLKENPQDAKAKKELRKLLKGGRKPAKGSRRKNKPARKTRLAKAGSVLSEGSTLPESATQPAQEDIQALVSLYKAGQLREAGTQARRLIETFPGTPVPFAILGMVLTGMGELDEAVTRYRHAVAIKPDYVEAHYSLGNALQKLGRFAEAVFSFKRVVELKPDHVAAHNNLGVTLSKLGKPEEAIARFEQALKIRPDHAVMLKNLGDLYEKTNKLDKADACIKKALLLSPNDPAINRVWAVLLKRQGRLNEAIQTLEPFVDADIPDTVLSRIHNELGKLYDREQDSEKAFHHFSAANELQAGSELAASFKKEAFLFKIDRMERTLTADWVCSWSVSEGEEVCSTPAFLVGFPRSGTTLLDQILDSHPGIQVMEERPILREITQQAARGFENYPSALAALDSADIQDLRDSYFREVGRHMARETGTLLVDKLPLNIRHIPLILRLFPNARVILALRHPCDVVLSNFMQHYLLNDAMANFFTLADSAHLYRHVMGLWQKCAALLPMKYHTVRYESLVADFEGEVRSLLEFLGLDWDDAVLDYSTHAKEKQIINTPSYQAVTEPINARAKYRWIRYREQLEPVLDDLSPFIEAFGYSEPEAGGEAA